MLHGRTSNAQRGGRLDPGADREKPGDKRFDRLIIGEVHPSAAASAGVVANNLQKVGMTVERYVPIMAWHWSHIALILPLAAHAETARGEMHHFATDFLALAGEDAGADLREVLTAI